MHCLHMPRCPVDVMVRCGHIGRTVVGRVCVMAVKESAKLSERCEEMARGGLVDVKFLLRDTPDATTEIVCGEVNAMLDCLERGEGVEFAFNDANK